VNKTVTQLKENLVNFLKLDDIKIVEMGTWVAVSYEDAWYPGEVISIKKNNIYEVKCMTRKKKCAVTFVWPAVDDIQQVGKKNCNIFKF